MTRQGFLDDESRRDLIELARDGLTANRLSRRANALVLLDDGMSYMAVAVEQSSGWERLNVHGAINLETGQIIMKNVLTVIEAMYLGMRLIHVFLDNARYHHAKLVKAWLALPGCRIKLHLIPAYCPHLNPIERLWGLMHRNITHNKCYASFKEFSIAMLNFLRNDVPGNWENWCNEVLDNFRIINPTKCRILT